MRVRDGSDQGAQNRSGSGAQNRARSAPALRHYQLSALAGIARELSVHRSTLVVAATGSGKTVTFAELVRTESTRGGRTLVLVNRDELVKQTRRKCEDVGVYADVEKAAQRANLHAKVVIASVQTLRGKRLARWNPEHFTKIVVDEAHHGVAPGYVAIFAHFTRAKIIGFTATPDRGDGKPLAAVFDSVAYRYDIQQAIADEYLVPIIARRIVVDSVDLSQLDERAGDFVQEQLGEAMSDERALRGQAVPLLEIARDRLTIAFCVNVAHAHELARVLNSYRPGCARAVDGTTDEDVRERLLEAFAAREFQFLCNCDVLVEGFDCPAVSCVAVCRPTKSRARFVQCGGRGLRLLGSTLAESIANGKRDCLILTCGDSKTPGLCGPADCLAGRDELSDDERAEIDRRLTEAQLEIGPVIAQAKDECAKRRAAIRVNAVVKYHAEFIDPFIGDVGEAPECDEAWETQAPSERQMKALESDGFGVTIAHLPKGFSRADAWRLLWRLKKRNDGPMCSYRAAKKLRAAGVRDTTNLSHERAKELLDKLRNGGWKSGAIAMEPEVRGARERGAA